MKMKKMLLMVGVALILSVLAGCKCPFSDCCKACKGDSSMKSEFKTVTTDELEKIVNDKSSLILDARTGKFDTGERIPGAKALSPDSSTDEVAKAIPNKNASIVTYCVNPKCPASNMLAKHLKELGYTNIMEYPEGIEGWIKDGNKVEKAK